MFRIRHFTNLRVDDGLVDVFSLEFLHLCVVGSPVQQLMDVVSLDTNIVALKMNLSRNIFQIVIIIHLSDENFLNNRP